MTEVPELFDTEEGDEWWLVGHHDEDVALAVLHTWVGAHPSEFVRTGFDFEGLSVTREWWRDAHDPTTDERWEQCEADDEGAVAFTRIQA